MNDCKIVYKTKQQSLKILSLCGWHIPQVHLCCRQTMFSPFLSDWVVIKAREKFSDRIICNLPFRFFFSIFKLTGLAEFFNWPAWPRSSHKFTFIYMERVTRNYRFILNLMCDDKHFLREKCARCVSSAE